MKHHFRKAERIFLFIWLEKKVVAANIRSLKLGIKLYYRQTEDRIKTERSCICLIEKERKREREREKMLFKRSFRHKLKL